MSFSAQLNQIPPPQSPLTKPFFYVGLWTVKILSLPFAAKDKTLVLLGFFEVLTLFLLSIFYLSLTSTIYIKPAAWIFSQDLYSSLAKQEIALKESSSEASLSTLLKIATQDAIPKQEAVMIGNSIYLSTGPLGEAAANIPQGEYKVEVVPIPGVDFTNVPKNILINKAAYELILGLSNGSGKIKGGQTATSKTSENKSSQKQALFVLKLFSDKNGNGLKDIEDIPLPWAGVTVKLNRI